MELLTALFVLTFGTVGVVACSALCCAGTFRLLQKSEGKILFIFNLPKKKKIDDIKKQIEDEFKDVEFRRMILVGVLLDGNLTTKNLKFDINTSNEERYNIVKETILYKIKKYKFVLE